MIQGEHRPRDKSLISNLADKKWWFNAKVKNARDTIWLNLHRRTECLNSYFSKIGNHMRMCRNALGLS